MRPSLAKLRMPSEFGILSSTLDRVRLPTDTSWSKKVFPDVFMVSVDSYFFTTAFHVSKGFYTVLMNTVCWVNHQHLYWLVCVYITLITPSV